jgi:tetratricopeptide (TPR) repeat protein
MKKLWNSDAVNELARVKIYKNNERFRRLFSDSIFDDFESAIVTDIDYEKFSRIIDEFKKRMDLLVSDSENLKNIPRVMDIFLWEVPERFSKKKYANVICKYSYIYAYAIINSLKLNNDYARAVCLSAIANIAKQEGRFDEALKRYSESIELRIAIQNSTLTAEIKNYIATMRSTGASIIYKETGDIKLALNFGLSAIFSSIGNIHLRRKNFTDAIVAFKNFFRAALDIIEIFPLNVETGDHINAALVNFNNALTTGKKYSNFFIKLREKDQQFNVFPECKDMFIPLINFVEEITKEIDKTIDCYNRKIIVFLDKFLNDPAAEKIKSDIAALYSTIGSIYHNINDYEKACCNFFKCSAFLSMALNDNFSCEIENKLAESYNKIASSYRYSKNYKNALSSIEKCLKIRREALSRDPENKTLMLNLAYDYYLKGNIYCLMKKYKEEIEMFQQSATLHEKLSEYGGEYLKFNNSLAKNFENIGYAFKMLKKPEEALSSYLNAIQIKEKLCMSDPENNYYKNSLGLTLFKIENIHSMQSNLNDSYEILMRAIQIFEQISSIEPENTIFLNNLGTAYEKMGLLYETYKDIDKSIIYFEKLTKLKKELCVKSPDDPYLKNSLSTALEKLARALYKRGRYEAVLESCFECINIRKSISFFNFLIPENNFKLANHYNLYGVTLLKTGKASAALEYFEKYHCCAKELILELPDNIEYKKKYSFSLKYLGEVNKARGDRATALKYFTERLVYALYLSKETPENRLLKDSKAYSFCQMGEMYFDSGEYEKAMYYFIKFNKYMEEIKIDENIEIISDYGVSCLKLGELYDKLGKNEKALKYYELNYSIFNKLNEKYPQHYDFRCKFAVACRRLAGSLKLAGDMHGCLKMLIKAGEILKEIEANPGLIPEFNPLIADIEKEIEAINQI